MVDDLSDVESLLVGVEGSWSRPVSHEVRTAGDFLTKGLTEMYSFIRKYL